MFKAVFLLKRRAGMTFQDFVTYYEGTHAKLGERVLPTSKRYMRRYLIPFPAPQAGESADADFDVITEIWFEDRAAFEEAISHLQDPAIANEIAQDEAQLFDRSKIRLFTVDERISEAAKR